MTHAETIALLREALDLLNDRSNFSLRRDRRVTSYALAARIDAHLGALAAVPADHVAVALARASLQASPDVQIDPDETTAMSNAEGIWVRAWVRVGSTPYGEAPDSTITTDRAAYRAVVAALPDATREVFLLHRAQCLDYPAIAERLNITVVDVEHHIADAILQLSTALGGSDDASR